jgi:arylsulfatase A-like enzyme
VSQVINLYDAVLVYLDEELGRFFEELQRMKLYDSALIILTADHGEAFHEHGHWQHGQARVQDGPGLYEEIIHVPLIVKWPGETLSLKIPHLVSQTDIYSTLLEAAGLKGSTGDWSTSLRHALQDARTPSSRTAIAEFIALADDEEDGAAMKIAIRNQHQKYIATLRSSTVSELYSAEIQYEELYDLRTDPLEETNLLEEQAASPLGYRRALRAYLAEAEVQRMRHRGATVTLDESSRKELEALGYIEK